MVTFQSISGKTGTETETITGGGQLQNQITYFYKANFI